MMKSFMLTSIMCFCYSIMLHVLKISQHKREQSPSTETKKKLKVKVLALHAVCQNGKVSCLFPAGIHSEFKASGISDNLPFSPLLPFGSIILVCLISDGKDQYPLLPSSSSDLQTHQLKGMKYEQNSIVFSTGTWTRWDHLLTRAVCNGLLNFN